MGYNPILKNMAIGVLFISTELLLKIIHLSQSQRQHNTLKSDTFCFTEPLRNRGTFNGLVTGNCTEIMEYTSPEEIAVCNLASIALPSFVDNHKNYDFNKLHQIVKMVTKNLNRVIDDNFYPVDKARVSNMKHRPIGIGVQGLSDTYMMMGYPFDSEEARTNMDIFETIYHASVEASMELAVRRTLQHFCKQSNVKGIFQFDMWNDHPYKCGSNRYDWNALKDKVKLHGIRNSLLVAPMPTASTSQILGNNECIEPYTSNIYLRRTLAGEFVVINKHLIKHFIKRYLEYRSKK